jgi:hypothetical protein
VRLALCVIQRPQRLAEAEWVIRFLLHADLCTGHGPVISVRWNGRDEDDREVVTGIP